MTSEENSAHDAPFFGGAITTKFPFKFIDVSDFRTVPDHQEVWTEDAPQYPLALICEILEYKKDIKDENSAQFFYDDLASLNNAKDEKAYEVVCTSMCVAGNDNGSKANETPLLPTGTFVHCLKGRSIIDRRKDSTVRAHCITWLANVRLPQVETDILITLTLPLETLSEGPNSETSKTNPSASKSLESRGEETFRFILKNFTVKNWGLFG